MAERPIECSGCKKKAAFDYTESLSSTKVRYEMCADCPILSAKLPALHLQDHCPSKENILGCEKCHTSLAMIQQGSCIGCQNCYVIFKDALYQELIQKKKIPAFVLSQIQKNPCAPLYSELALSKQENPHTQINTLSEELSEALKKENYEQAAWIRDQIKILLEKKNG